MNDEAFFFYGHLSIFELAIKESFFEFCLLILELNVACKYFSLPII